MCSAMSTIASNSAVLGGHCTVVLGLEHARTIAKHGWTRSDIRRYLWMNSGNAFRAISRDHRYRKVYNRNLPKRLKREPDSRILIAPVRRQHPPLHHGRTRRAFHGLHSRVGTYEHAGPEADRCGRGAGRQRMR